MNDLEINDRDNSVHKKSTIAVASWLYGAIKRNCDSAEDTFVLDSIEKWLRFQIQNDDTLLLSQLTCIECNYSWNAAMAKPFSDKIICPACGIANLIYVFPNC